MNPKQKQTIQHVYDSIAEHFDVTRYKPWPETTKFAEKLEPGSQVLDIGCGNGRNSRYLASKGFQVTGIDISPAQVEIAKKRAEKELPENPIQFHVADATKLPFQDGQFSAVLYIATLHHLPSADERLKSLIEIFRVLKPGGLTCHSRTSGI